MQRLKDAEKRCCVCGVQRERQDENRSFHKFPKNEEIKEKWFDAIGRRVTQKDARVCSDHFKKEDFPVRADGQEAVVLRRLVRNAVPCLSNNAVEPNNTPEAEKSLLSATVVDCVCDSLETNNVPNPSLMCEVLLEEDTNVINVDEDPLVNCNERSEEQNRNKRIPEVVYNGPVRKRCRVDGFMQEILCREDFTSESGWQLYRDYVDKSRKQIKTLQQKCLRYEKKLCKKINDLLE